MAAEDVVSSSAFVVHFFLTVIMILFKPIQCLSSYPSYGTTRSPPAMFAIGGGQADVGTNAILNSSAPGNKPFNGIDCDPPLPTGRLSNCWVVADFVAMALGYDESPPPFLAVVNSSKRFDRVITSRGSLVTVGQQIDQFGAVVRPRLIALLGPVAAGNFLAQSFFLLATGSIDIAEQRANAPPSSDPRFLRLYIAQYVDYIRTLYALGGRVFGIVAPSLVGCSSFYYNSSNSSSECDARSNSLSLGAFNRLASALRLLRLTYPDFRYSICNSPNFYFDVIANAPGSPGCGLKEVRASCCGNRRAMCSPTSALCGNRDEYFFWNLYLLTSEGSRLHSAACFGRNPRYWTPVSFAALLKD
ncbi:unnamed protein product [Linum tenue]|uniref:Uncharacterized protein n=1 Tax=Linum tenue TaxID=586396 RepID=A0AAV0RDH2_9ROSI|nr:unnamed protein product [Linum tenue]